ncbi:MAG: phosphoenolpyruvate synthase, partial [Nevskiaceae bacterium]|nr:phosphoenolpyruvate synthase [Nevskiaceae bacterium]
MNQNILWLHELRLTDLARVGGKNSSLGEMIACLTDLGVSVPGGFATTAEAFKTFIGHNDLSRRIFDRLAALDVEDVPALTAAGKQIRGWVIDAPLQPELDAQVRAAYAKLCADNGGGDVAVAVRSSATAEDLPDASFAGQQETFLNVTGADDVVRKVKEVFASLYNDRAIAYRVHHGFKHEDVFLSAGVQLMVRSDVGASGVLFTLDTESGFRDVVFITASYGLGEMVVQGAVNPDEFYVYKPNLRSGRPAMLRRALGAKAIRMVYSNVPGERVRTEDTPAELRARFCITDEDVQALARQALTIEQHYGRPMDIEWARDGVSGKLFIVQARPETVRSRAKATRIERYSLQARGTVITEGRAIGQKIGCGVARVVRSLEDMNRVQAGDVLVADMTDPDWEPVMKRASAIVTNRGGRTCHAAIIARELGVPAVVGTGNALEMIEDGKHVTVSCAEGDTGTIYDGVLPFERITADLDNMPPAPLKIMMNVANPERAFDFAQLPNAGIGLARLEMIIASHIGVHPLALLEYDRQDADIKRKIDARMAGYAGPVDFYVDRLTEGIATITASVAPAPVIVRLSDFKSNEYANLIGGARYEPQEENPMIGFRGASRYVDPAFEPAFALECRAVKRVRENMGLTNLWVMIPFVRTLEEGREVIQVLARHGLRQGEHGLKVIMMCEIPSNALLADEFLEIFDGFSIGSNDMTQLTLGLDRDSAIVADLFDERDPA